MILVLLASNLLKFLATSGKYSCFLVPYTANKINCRKIYYKENSLFSI